MSQITGGRVCYARTVQPAQYESKKAEVELFFAVEEAGDYTAIFNQAAAEAHGMVYKILGISPSGKPIISDKQALVAEKTGGATGTTETGEKQKRQPKKAPNEAAKVENPAAMGEPAAPSTAAPAGSTTGAATPPAGSSANGAPAASTSSTASAANPASIMDEFAAEAAEITDKFLADAMSKKNAEIKNTRAIKELVGKYGVARASELPQEKRQGFLNELNTLKAAA